MEKLINIDNGGTLTDICVIEGSRVYRTKTLTTPYDLSKCLLDGLKKASRTIYGREDLGMLLRSTKYIRYSTTQGTNALVERKGPRLGLILAGTLDARALQEHGTEPDVYDALVAQRLVRIDGELDEQRLEAAAVRAVNTLASAGANRIVIACGGADYIAVETRIKRILLRKFPSHLLGAVPLLYSHDMVDNDDNHVRRSWTALLNAFLHPAMEHFLYSAEAKLRAEKTKNPLLIFRNDGHSARVAKTIALKTYSSGPRGGMEAARALARHYGFAQLLTMDIGGTTTDIGLVENGVVRGARRGAVAGMEVSFPLSDVISPGVGGSSIIRVADRQISVGPQSVGSTPGPACFGLGGREATITDAFLLQGLLDPASYFGGELKIDADRARAAVLEKIGGPLDMSEPEAIAAMEHAWVAKVAGHLRGFAEITTETTLAGFGGAGPFVVCKVAEAAGINRVVIPGLAAVFSAYGIGFSDIAHQYEAALATPDAAALKDCVATLRQRAGRDMAAEGFTLEQCRLEYRLLVHAGAGELSYPLADEALPPDLPHDALLAVALSAVKPLPHAQLTGQFGMPSQAAVRSASRRILLNREWQEVPLYRAENQQAGASAAGPAILEDAFFTCRIERGWSFEINGSGDILLSRG